MLLVVLALLAVLTGGGAAQPADAQAASAAERMVSIARGELRRGVREVPDGSNRASRIRMYGGSTQPRFYPAPWCAYFVSWVARRAGRPLGPAGQGFGYVPYIKAWALRTGRWRKAPRSGDLVMFPQHVGMVESVYRNGTLTTIEGNSSNRVARRWRRWRDASGYVRFATGGGVSRRRSAPKARRTPAPTRTPLVARISVYPSTEVAVRQEVGFSANDSSGDVVRYAWDLDGDGRFDDAKGDNAARVYTKPGTVRVALKVTDRRGRTAVDRKPITVEDNRPPVAVLDLPTTAVVGEEVEADASGSTDPEGKIARFEWDLDGDGRWEQGGEERKVRFTRPGVHTAGLRVVDERGAVTEAIRTVHVTARPPEAKATAPARTALNRDVQLDGGRSSSPHGAALTFRWDVDGDGAPDAEGRQATWRFTSPGAREVKLVVVDEWGQAAESSVRIVVANESPTGAIDLVGQAVATEPATFDAGRSFDPDSRLTAFEWDFDGDGSWDATGPRPAWRFPSGGSRTVRLRVTDDFGATHVASAGVRALERPRARIEALYADGRVGSAVAFSAAATTDPDSRIEKLEWDLDADGRPDQTTRSPITKVWWTPTRAGDHVVAVAVTDADGLTARASLVLTAR